MLKGEKHGSYCEPYYLSGGIRAYLVAGIAIATAIACGADCSGFVYYPVDYDHPRCLWNIAGKYIAAADTVTKTPAP
jgi:hypothetical protein